ncbi:Uncharacterized protein Adt_42103 [Abeliophyllum distichum]|uniref:Retrotransposon gag domain-containing protein n=1 Tax=Abeliophyllum distichum TaxID=126358 RepID=A0ABD1PRM0_9LAMI
MARPRTRGARSVHEAPSEGTVAESESETHGMELPPPTYATEDPAAPVVDRGVPHPSAQDPVDQSPPLPHSPTLDLERKLDEMLTKKIESALTKRKDKRRQIVLGEDPFAPEIMAVPLPKGFKQPMIESYDGVTDPLDHLLTFVDMMRLYAAPDAVMCWSFPPTLRREARDWVATLAPRSVKTFDQLSQSFVAYFLSSKRKRKTAIGLMQVIQEKEETLQDYLACFSRAMLGIKDLQMSAVVTAIMNGTRNRSFKMSLSKNPPESMQELLRKWDKYVDAEEAERVTKSLHEGREPENNKRKSHDNQRVRDDKGNRKSGLATKPSLISAPPTTV